MCTVYVFMIHVYIILTQLTYIREFLEARFVSHFPGGAALQSPTTLVVVEIIGLIVRPVAVGTCTRQIKLTSITVLE